jgi:DNA-binding beta-propeller fold protein YncE
MAVGLCLASTAAAATIEAPLDTRQTAEATFTTKPQLEKVDGGAKITFAVSTATDVEVAILNAKGRVVRHLAAGLLGKRAPEPLARNSLRQELVWDGKADGGRAAAGGPFKVRVRIGSTTRLDKHLCWDGNTLSPIRSLAVSDTGELYVLMGSWGGRGRTELRVFDRSGKYLRTIMPYSAATPATRTKSVGRLEVDGRRLPVVFNGHGHNLYPLTVGLKRQNMAWNPRGYLVVVSTPGTPFEHGVPRHLLAFHPQGGAPEGVPFVGPLLQDPTGILWGHGVGDDPFFDHVACSPDGKHVYYVPSTVDSPHAVYRLHWGEDRGAGYEAAFLGEDFHPGSDRGHLNDPQGIATDPQGRIYVCDRGNNRVTLYAADGKFLDAFDCEDPEQIAVHPKTGVIYVACRPRRRGGRPKDIGPLSMREYRAWKQRHRERMARWPKPRPPKLLKFSVWKKGGPRPKVVARLDGGVGVMALDPTASPPKLWVTRKGLRPVIDRGDTLELGDDIASHKGLYYPAFIQADPKRNRILVRGLMTKYKNRTVDLTTGEKKTFLSGVSEVALAPDGTLYGTGTYRSNVLLRFDAEGKPAPWPGSESNKVRTRPYTVLGLGLGLRGLTVAPNGDIYFVRAHGGRVQARVDVFAPDGTVKKEALIDGMGIGDCGIGVDAAGNVYVGANVKPRLDPFPKAFAGKVPKINWLCWAQWRWGYRPAPWRYSMRNEYLYHWGSVFKFGPSGGAFYGRSADWDKDPAKLPEVCSVTNASQDTAAYRSGYYYRPVRVDGAKWRYPGMGIVPASERMWGDPSCVCMTSRLAVDPYGRVFLPNVFGFCVEQVDSAGNRISRVGTYGNPDDVDGEIRWAWPAFVDVAGDRLYVSDSVNRRITVVRIDYAARAEAAVP